MSMQEDYHSRPPRTVRERVERLIWPHGKTHAEFQADGEKVTAGVIFPALDRADEEFSDQVGALQTLRKRRRKATRRAMMLRGTEALATGITGAGISEAVRRRSLKLGLASVVFGGSAVIAAMFMGEEQREIANKWRKIRKDVRALR